mmetsp:Transcript_33537/g.103908  ORF Transcript_33537/g.103908 Transcript_33537/m.103908 type:complete len:201 (+) Transcript_33537:721-1323(+)
MSTRARTSRSRRTSAAASRRRTSRSCRTRRCSGRRRRPSSSTTCAPRSGCRAAARTRRAPRHGPAATASATGTRYWPGRGPSIERSGVACARQRTASSRTPGATAPRRNSTGASTSPRRRRPADWRSRRRTADWQKRIKNRARSGPTPRPPGAPRRPRRRPRRPRPRPRVHRCSRATSSGATASSTASFRSSFGSGGRGG